MSVSDRFTRFCKTLEFTTAQMDVINGRFDAICNRLNKDFWGFDLKSGGKFVGSVGRQSANSWESDIDMLFEMPWNVYTQYQNYSYNGQSALLQAVKKSIGITYPNTDVGGDGQIVNVPFTDGLHFEVLPAFKNTNGTYTYPDSNNSGSWRITNPDAEISAISYAQIYSTNSNLLNLCRMLRAWKSYNSVPIGGLLLDTFAYNFLINWQNRNQSYLYYDFMTRDFFSYLMNIPTYVTSWTAIGSGVTLYKKGEFIPSAKKAYDLSLEAIQHDTDRNFTLADTKWKDIYGYRITP